jgi:hypothetical protein
MALFDQFFGKRKAPLERQSAELNRMGETLLAAAGVDFDHASQLEQALIGTFFFGMAHAYGMLNKLTPPQVHALVLKAYSEVFHYTPEAAVQAAQSCIDATAPGNHDTMNAILHRGIDGHAQYIKENEIGLKENIRSVLDHFRK